MDIRDAYSEWAATYDTDRNLTRDLDEAVTSATLALSRYTAILEVGCGTGKNTALLARLGAHVLALDFSAGMIHRASAKRPGANVAFAVADLTRPWPCANHTVNLIVCNLVLEHIADLPFVFAEASRTLVDGGQFFICELHPFEQYGGARADFQRGTETVAIAAFVHHLSDFLAAAEANAFTLRHLREWWLDDDRHTPPRLVSFMFEK